MTTASPTRRQFAQALAVLATASAAPAALADDASAAADAKAYSEALTVIVRYRFGRKLTAEQLKRVEASALRIRTRSEGMKKPPLANSDDPIAAFRADLP